MALLAATTLEANTYVVMLNAILNTLQVCFLAYLAAKYHANGP